MAHILKDYIALLDRSGLLAAPIPREIDQTAPVALVSYASREAVPCFFAREPTLSRNFWKWPRREGRWPM